MVELQQYQHINLIIDMSEQDQTKMAKAGQKNKYRFNNRGNQATRTSCKSKIAELEDDVFDVGAASDPAKFSKSLKSIENYIQVNYKTCDDIVKVAAHESKIRGRQWKS